MTEEIEKQQVVAVTEATPAPEEELVEVDIEVDAAAAQASETSNAAKPATGKAEGGKVDDDEDDEDDEDEEDDERLSSDQRDDKLTELQLKRIKRRRKDNRRREIEARERRELQMRALRAEQTSIQTQAQVLQMQAQQVERDIHEATRSYQYAERQSAAAMSKGDGVAFQQWERKKQEAAALYQEKNSMKARLGNGFQQLQAQWNEMSQQLQAEPAVRPDVRPEQDREPPPITDRHKRNAESFVAENPWIKEGGSDAEVIRSLDLAVMADGFDPSTRAYWNELRDRAKAALPRRFKTVTRTAPPIGTGRDVSANKRTMRFPASVVQACKDAGYWDDPKQRNDYFNRVMAAQKNEQTRPR